MAREVSNREDMLDSRDIIAAIDDFETEATFAFEEKFGEDAELPEDYDPADYLDEDDADLYRALKALEEEAQYSADWNSGATLINDSYFTTYAQDLAEDIGGINRETEWPATHIDWEAAARDLQMDYGAVDFDGVTFWIRS